MIDIKVNGSQATDNLLKIKTNLGKASITSLIKASQKLDTNLKSALSTGLYNLKSKSGKLQSSFGYQMSNSNDGKSELIYGSKLAYAAIQEHGGKVRITDRMKAFAWAKYRETGEIMWKAIALKSGYMTIPKHLYLERTLRKSLPEFNAIIDSQVSEAIK